MNTGQMLLTTAAMVLLGTTVLSVNRSFNQQGVILEQTEIGVYAISVATSVIEEASGMAFDQATVDNSVTGPSSLTSPNRLGPDLGETTTPPSTTNFNDFDDFNSLRLGVKVAGVDSFTVKSSVYYIDPSAPDIPLNSRTFFKRIDVSVFGTASADTIRMSYIFSYFMFR